MKRRGNLFSTLVSMENLQLAHQNARKGKTHYQAVQMVDADPEQYLLPLRQALIDRTFTTSPYRTKTIYEPKQRVIYKLPYYPDRIVHHAVMQVMQPIWDKQFIFDLYSAIPGKGLHAGSYRLRKFLQDADHTRYCLKFDITKYYPSILPDKLYEIVQRTVKDPDVLWLLKDVIFSNPDRGVPIGNYLSQYFSNLYLTPFDHWIKEDLGMKYFIRYCDDGVILHSDRGRLKEIRNEIAEYLTPLGLTLNQKTCIFPVDRCGIDFLGYRCFRTHTLLRKSSARRFKKKVREIEKNYQTMSTDACWARQEHIMAG
ncbi:reverse transcriptase/maturase family protein [Methanogenium cariaci]|uniref:reverse transcriptase/maturase family protein n=1 Tax=Methanogenium cariaci TaxID=2197 RepID=UPI0007802B06|nr:reverse transcriptase/maturase family protein [Methanogenium cariaci]